MLTIIAISQICRHGSCRQSLTFLSWRGGTVELDNPVSRTHRAVLVTALGEIPDQATALSAIFDALEPGGTLSITEVIFDPHIQRRQHVLALALAARYRERVFFGHRLAYVLPLEKP